MSLIRKTFEGNATGISEACNFAKETLSSYKINKKAIVRADLSLEESALKLIEAAKKEVKIEVAVRKTFFEYRLELSVPGEEITFYDSSLIGESNKSELDQYTETALRNVLIGALGDTLSYMHKGGYNKVQIKVQKIERSMLFAAVIAMVLALITGLLFKNLASHEIQQMVCDNALSPLTTMFMNALKMLVVPVVFFSIITSVSQFSNFSEFGKIGGRIIGLYAITTIIASIIAILVFNLINPGEFGSCKETFENTNAAIESSRVKSIDDFSIMKTIVNIVPDNIVKPYAESNTLQIIFIAVLLGAAISMIGEYSSSIKNLLDGCNLLFSNATKLVIKTMPIAIFTSITDLIIKTNLDTVLQIGGYFIAFIVALIMMVLFYSFMLGFIAKLNIIVFFKKFADVMIKAFSFGSSSACIPDTILCCKKLGVSEKISAFSIPMGSTINMNGTCIHLVLATLFLGKLCGFTFVSSNYVIIVFSSLIMSIGCPAIPGASLVCLSVMMMQFGIPTGAIALFMGIDSVLNMFRTLFNVIGDAVSTIIVAKREKLLDEDIYYSDTAE